MSQPPADSQRFMVFMTYRVPTGGQAELMALLPQEQAHVRELAQQGRVEALYVSADRAQTWLVLRAASQEEAERTLATFPLFPYMQPTYTALTPQ